ncbi:MAG TPA: sugar-binding domain-containing protein [Candidatus Limnocylindrales bacterium]|nr:sugar-binding domain-containing protein [Candidatus Limnocylindrales bacterium]
MTAAERDTTELVEQVARLFYEEQLPKIEIAARLAISRFRVARLIDRALAEGIVRIEFRSAPGQDRALGAAIVERYGIGRCVVASSSEPMAVARLAAEVVDGLLEPGESIGIAWGSTLARVVRAMPVRDDPTIDVVQLAGSSPRLGSDADPGDLTRVLAERLGATHHRMHAPAFVDSPELRAALVRLPDVAGVVSRFTDLAIALLGIGAFGGAGGASSSLIRSGALSAAEAARLSRKGAVGDLLVHPFTATGRFLAPDLAARALAIGIEDLRRIPSVVAVASGSAKVAAIRGALATGLPGVLVTSAATAQELLA